MKSLQKKLKVITLVFAFIAVAMQNVNSAEECFETLVEQYLNSI